MIRYTRGDIFDADAHALVNPVNCVGTMGKGLAKQFKRRFPDNFTAYKRACVQGALTPGRVLTVPVAEAAPVRYVINLPTKRHWRAKSRLEDVVAGLRALVESLQERSIPSVAVPPLGCGLGGLEWADVRAAIEAELGALDAVQTIVYGPR